MRAMTRQRFEVLVAEALDTIPEPFRSHLESVQVVVEEEADAETLRDLGLAPTPGRASPNASDIM